MFLVGCVVCFFFVETKAFPTIGVIKHCFFSFSVVWYDSSKLWHVKGHTAASCWQNNFCAETDLHNDFIWDAW